MPVFGALVAAFATVLLAQTPPPWTAPRTWTTGDLLTAAQFNSNFRDNLLNLRGVRGVCGFRHHRHGQRGYGAVSGIARWSEFPVTIRLSRWIWTRPRARQPRGLSVGPEATIRTQEERCGPVSVSGRLSRSSSGVYQ